MNKLCRSILIGLVAFVVGASHAAWLPAPKPHLNPNPNPKPNPSGPPADISRTPPSGKSTLPPAKPTAVIKRPGVVLGAGAGAAAAAAAAAAKLHAVEPPAPMPTPESLTKWYARDLAALKDYQAFLDSKARAITPNAFLRGAIVSDVYLDLVENPAEFNKHESSQALAEDLVARMTQQRDRLARAQRYYAERHLVVGKLPATVKKEARDVTYIDEAVSPAANPEQALASKKFVSHVLSLLTPAQSKVVEARLQGYTTKEIAAQTGNTPAAVSSTMRDAKDRIPPDVVPRIRQRAASGAGA